MRPSPRQLVAARGLLGMTQEQLANAAGCSKRTIENFEAGKSVPYEDTMAKIMTALELRGIEFSNGDRPTVTHDRSKATIPS